MAPTTPNWVTHTAVTTNPMRIDHRSTRAVISMRPVACSAQVNPDATAASGSDQVVQRMTDAHSSGESLNRTSTPSPTGSTPPASPAG